MLSKLSKIYSYLVNTFRELRDKKIVTMVLKFRSTAASPIEQMGPSSFTPSYGLYVGVFK